MNKLYRFFSEKAFIYRFTVIASVFRFRKQMQKRGIDQKHISYRHYLHAFCLVRCTLGEYTDYELFLKSDDEIRTYLTMYNKHRMLSRLGDRHAALTITGSKHLFNQKYAPFLGRTWLSVADSTPQEFLQFLRQHPQVIFKRPDAFQGNGIERFTYTDEDTALLKYEHLKKENALVEEVIVQHKSVAAFNPQTVNTLRISTLCLNGNVHFIGACFKTGNGNSSVDNLVKGGVGCGVDVETGRVFTDGFDHDLNTVRTHPVSGCTFLDFRFPNWQTILKTVQHAAVLCEQNGDGHFIGWDVAVTPDGVAIIEGNWNQGLTLIQNRQSGKATVLESILKEEGIL